MFYKTLWTNRSYFPDCINQVVFVMQIVFSVMQEINVHLDKIQVSEAKGISPVCVFASLIPCHK